MRAAMTTCEASRRSRLAAGTILVTAVLAGSSGCGGDDRLSAKEYRAQATSICTEYERKFNALRRPQSPGELASYLETATTAADSFIDEFDALRPPENVEGWHELMVAESELARDAFRDASQAAEEGNSAAVQAELQRAQEAGDRYDAAAKRVGLAACAQ